MDVSELCSREIVTVPASASVREAAVAMRDHQVGALAITDPLAPGRVIGMVTDRDLVLDLLAAGRPAEGQPIGELCHTDLAGVPVGTPIGEAVRTMQRKGVRRLLVMGHDNAVFGLVSLDDILEAVAVELDALAGTLRAGFARERSRVGRPADAPRNLYTSRPQP